MNTISKIKIIYIAEFSLPNMSAYSVHVLKMCGAASELGYKVNLVLPFINKSYNTSKIKKDYSLKRKINLISFFKKKKRMNFFYRILFSLFLFNYLKNNRNNFIISRSILPSILLAIINIKNILEIHTEITGFTKFLFFLTNFNFIKKNLKFITLNHYIKKKLKLNKQNTLILDDAVDLKDFNYKSKKIIKNTCVYTGSFAPGKGFDLILKLSKIMPKIYFHLYGNIKTLNDQKILNSLPKNMKMKGYIPYNNVGRTLAKYKILLMPYSNKVGVLIKNISVENYFSPLKMFEYMASGKIIIGSDLKVYRHILKKNYNSILLNPKNLKSWKKSIMKILFSKKYYYLGSNARKDVKKFTWNLRVKKIIQFNEK